ncbi:hypothetical protein ZWY2020_031059 [Hordeum vulgare]|nr:hypothetical protein ZWY2020_031059 [Hordeum vulgare]
MRWRRTNGAASPTIPGTERRRRADQRRRLPSPPLPGSERRRRADATSRPRADPVSGTVSHRSNRTAPGSLARVGVVGSASPTGGGWRSRILARHPVTAPSSPRQSPRPFPSLPLPSPPLPKQSTAGRSGAARRRSRKQRGGRTSVLVMGQGPSVSQENSRIEYAVGSRKGSNSKVENAHAAILDLDGSSSTSFFGVYDGHAGSNVALYCAKRLHSELVNDEDYKTNLNDAMRGPFLEWMSRCREMMTGEHWLTPLMPVSNCWVVSTLLLVLREPHTWKEAQLILAAVVSVRTTYLIGDFHFKSNEGLLPAEQIVSCTPDIHTEEITDDTKYLLIASTNFWDTISCQSAVNYLRHYSGSYSVPSICDMLLNQIKNPVDNVTLMLIYFKPSARLPPTAPPAPMVG